MVPSLDVVTKAMRRLRILGRSVIAQGRVKLTPLNTPILAAFTLYASSQQGVRPYRTFVIRKCGPRALTASWFFELSIPTLIAGSGTTPYIITDTRDGWQVTAEP
jgi:hypothetical protein